MSQNALRILCEKTFIRHRQRDSENSVSSSSRPENKEKERNLLFSLPLKYVMKANLLAYATTYSQFRIECIRA